MRVNTANKVAPVYTHEGARASTITAEQALRRSVMSCMLWEDTFYEDGVDIVERINDLAKKVPFDKIANLAIQAREDMKLRHAPLMLAKVVSDRQAGRKMGDLLERIVQRPDELSEFLALYWKDGKRPLAKQIKVGLARAFRKFDEYALAKYNRDHAVKLRDVLFLCHAKPVDKAQEKLWKKLVEGTLATPDTWEVALSAGEGKAETFARLMAEKKLGALAFLRNLRNMNDAGVNKGIVAKYGDDLNMDRVLPFRFISAARAVPQWSDIIEHWMLKALKGADKLTGKTVIVVDNSGSMEDAVSKKSDITRADAACALAILIREICEDAVVIGYGSDAKVMPNYRGFALRDAIRRGPGGGTDTGYAVKMANREKPDRVIVVTDEQSHTSVDKPFDKGYIINVASFKNGIGYKDWVHIDGWSESVVDFIRMLEKL